MGTVTTMDALLTQSAVARQILKQHGHYLMVVKKNQLKLYRAIEVLFQTPPLPMPTKSAVGERGAFPHTRKFRAWAAVVPPGAAPGRRR